MDDSAQAPLPRAGEVHHAMDEFIRTSTRRRLLPTTFHLGVPTGAHTALVHEHWHDHALRVDLVERALSCTALEDAFAWLTRPGRLVPHEHDHAWYAAMLAAYAIHALTPPDFYVITREGWRELRTGETRTWYRVRPSRARGRLEP